MSTFKSEEIWAQVPGYEGMYEVSSRGQVKGLPRTTFFNGRWGATSAKFPGQIMKLDISTGGYSQIDLSKDGKKKKHLAHRLVLLAFSGPISSQVNHKDGNKLNNCLDNLESCTARENLIHATRVLRKRIGEKNGNSKLTEHQVSAIRQDQRILREIAKDYGVSLQAIHHIRSRKNWAAF